MQRPCDFCGNPYEAKRRTSRFCSSNCRVKNNGAKPKATKLPASLDEVGERRAAEFISAIERELTEVDRLNTALGQQAMLLARKIGAPMDTGSSTAALSKELRLVLDEAVKGATRAADPVDELRRKRDQRAAG